MGSCVFRILCCLFHLPKEHLHVYQREILLNALGKALKKRSDTCLKHAQYGSQSEGIWVGAYS